MNVLANISKYNSYAHQPCVALAIVFALGIVLGRYWLLSWEVWSILSGLCIMVSLLQSKLARLFLYLSLLCLGALYFQHQYYFPPNHISFLSFDEQKQCRSIEGIVDSDVQLKPTAYGWKRSFEFRVLGIEINQKWQKCEGRVLVEVFKDAELHYGDRLILQGTLRKPYSPKESRFSYQQYLEDHGLFFIWIVGKNKTMVLLSQGQANAWLAICLKIKHRFKEILAKYLAPQEASMIQAMLLGDRSFLTKDMYALFSKTGTSHILAISGMNMTIIAGIFLFILKLLRLPRSWQFVLTGGLLFIYALMSGWSASVVRSVLMAAIVLSSFCLEQEGDAANSLGLAAIILLLLNPIGLFDIGFQLSFICVGVIIYLYPIIQWISQRYIKVKLWVWLSQALGISIAAWIGTVVLIAYQFNIVSLIAILANVLIVPLADMIVILGVSLVAAGMICPFLCVAIAGSLKMVFNVTLLLITFFAKIPGGHFYVEQIQLWQLCLYYLGLAFLIGMINMAGRFFTRT